MTTEELLSGMVTEEVELRVFRVQDDGAGHDLVAEPLAGLTAAQDGSILLLRAPQCESRSPGREAVDAVFVLGREGTHPIEPDDPSLDQWADIAVGRDGVEPY